MNRKPLYIIFVIILLAGGAVLCTVRWRAWFGMPVEPEWTEDVLEPRFTTFTGDTVPGFYFDGLAWQDLTMPDTLSVLLLGDVHNSMEAPDWQALSARHPHLDAWAQLGDLLERPYFYYRQLLLHQLSGSVFDTLPMLPCPGNHEYVKGLIPVLPPLWRETFPCPDNGPVDFLGSSYYVDFGRMRFVSIDTQGIRRLLHYTRYLTWLRGVIESAERDDRFVVVQMHHPVYSCGVGRSNPLNRLFLYPALREADLVFAGHDHGYMRHLPFIDTNAARKYYLHTLNPEAERVAAGVRLYQVLDLWGEAPLDTLRVRAFLMDTCARDGAPILYDEVVVTHPEGETVYTTPDSLPAEIILLPEKYRGREGDSKVRRFEQRRNDRLGL